MSKFICLKDDLSKFDNFDTNMNDVMKKYAGRLPCTDTDNWSKYQTFWPPRLVDALKRGEMVCFFGAGLSMACGMPNWDSLLQDHLGISKDFLDDDNAKNDPLTQAELASHKIGADQVQKLTRSAVSHTDKPSYNHFLLARLKLKFYITSNYDSLFEEAWARFDENKLIIILNDSDLHKHFNDGKIDAPKDEGAHYLFKIHGCINKKDELLILTRSDYRKHYRSNRLFFDTIVETLFLNYHTLFLGFSHKDPEITRLVEDSIWCWEKDDCIGKQPNFYSLQFDMKNITPEIFAARGIVALSPPIILSDDNIKDKRSLYLAHALMDIHSMLSHFKIDCVSLENDIDTYSKQISKPLEAAIKCLEKHKTSALQSLLKKDNCEWMRSLFTELTGLGELARQGVYLLDEYGSIAHYELCDDLKSKRAEEIKRSPSFVDRPYFRQARTFRKPFISDIFNSIYNELATFFICYPILEGHIFKGLLFSACQIGQWTLPVTAAEPLQIDGKSVILVDSNGVCLFPPNKEFDFHKGETLSGESRIGYFMKDLLVISRLNKLVSRVIENLIPLGTDDDHLIIR